ncbi:hypothetical protein BVX99_01640 [bacterium F16]|nr:hypothetical protein BVX99_01640 [bacterium F16]
MIDRLRIIALSLAVVTSMAISAQDDALKHAKIEQLIKQLGAEKSKDRKAAREELITYGALTRSAIKAYEDSDDPEIRSAVKELLAQLRHMIIPGAENEVKDLFVELDNNESGDKAWEHIAKLKPDYMAELLLEVSRNEKWVDSLKSGVYAYLANCDPRRSAAVVTKLGKSERTLLNQILDRTNSSLYSMRPKQMLLFYCLGDNSRAVGRAFDVWDMSLDPQAVDIAAMAIGRSSDPKKFWSIGGRKIFFENSLKKRCKLMSFYCGIAQTLGKPHLVRGFMSLGGVDGADADDARSILAVLEKTGDDDLITSFLNGCRGAEFKYQTMYRFYRQNNQRMSDDEFYALLDGLQGEDAIYKLFVTVSSYNLNHGKVLLERILAADPVGSTYDNYAYSMLATYAEEVGLLTQASDYWMQRVKSGGQDGELRVADKMNTRHAEELKALAELENPEFSKRMLNGRQLELDGNTSEAIAQYRKAIELEPRQTCSYRRIMRIYRSEGRFRELNDMTRALLMQTPLTSREKLEWSYLYSDAGDFDAAQKMLEQYSRAVGSQYSLNYPTAILAERRCDLTRAEDAFEKQLKRKTISSTLRRQAGLVKFKLRKFDEAEELLLDHLLLKPFDTYARLLLFYCRTMAGQDDSAALKAYIRATGNQRDDWSNWLLLYAVGDVDDETLMKTAGMLGADVNHYGQTCEAYFYSGLKALIHGDQARAVARFRETIKMNITLFIEHNWAQYELKRLGIED